MVQSMIAEAEKDINLKLVNHKQKDGLFTTAMLLR